MRVCIESRPPKPECEEREREREIDNFSFLRNLSCVFGSGVDLLEEKRDYFERREKREERKEKIKREYFYVVML